MSYIEKNLGESEKLIRLAKFHWFHHFQALVTFAFFLSIGAVLTALSGAYGWLVAGVFVGLIFYLRLRIPIWTTEIGVTNQRLIKKWGLFSRHTDEVELWAVEAVNLSQDIWGRIFGYGRIIVQGMADDRLRLPPVAEPLAFRKAMQDAISRARPPGAVAAREQALAAARRMRQQSNSEQ